MAVQGIIPLTSIPSNPFRDRVVYDRFVVDEAETVLADSREARRRSLRARNTARYLTALSAEARIAAMLRIMRARELIARPKR